MSKKASGKTMLFLVSFILVITIVMFFYRGLLFASQPIGDREQFKEITSAVTSSANQGVVSLCINYPPIPIFNKSFSIQARIPFVMYVYGQDNDVEQSLTFSLNNTNMFNISSYNATTGIISFTPKIGYKGNYSILITVTDTTGCGSSNSSDVLSLEIYGNNTPPSFNGPIPNLTWTLGSDPTNIIDLDDYFTDSDNDPITFTYGLNQKVSVFIDSLNRVSFTSYYYGTDVIRFTANDSDKANYSNVINLTILFPPTGDSGGGSSGDSGGSGGGSGGGGGGGGGGGAPPSHLAGLGTNRTITNILLSHEMQYYTLIRNDRLVFKFTKPDCIKLPFSVE